jgi:hypothetical protein
MKMSDNSEAPQRANASRLASTILLDLWAERWRRCGATGDIAIEQKKTSCELLPCFVWYSCVQTGRQWIGRKLRSKARSTNQSAATTTIAEEPPAKTMLR